MTKHLFDEVFGPGEYKLASRLNVGVKFLKGPLLYSPAPECRTGKVQVYMKEVKSRRGKSVRYAHFWGQRKTGRIAEESCRVDGLFGVRLDALSRELRRAVKWAAST